MNLATLVSNEVQGTKAIPTIKELRKELQAKSGAPCSPKMSMASIILKLNELASQPQINDDANVVIKTKATKPQGIGNKILELLKSGVSPKETLETIQATFEGCKTTMACVYWYKSKINNGLM
jgi:hypothetical protein